MYIPVQRGNEAWVLEHETGVIAIGVQRVVPAIEQVLSTSIYRENAEKYRHDGVFKTAASVSVLVEQV